MTLRLSTGARTLLTGPMGLASIFKGGSLQIWSGTQPASADSPMPGTLLGVTTISSGTLTAETQASQTITVGGTAGTISAVTVGTFNIIPDGAVTWTTDVNTTAGLLANAINCNGYYTATVASAIVTIRPRPGTGAAHNAYVVATSVTGGTTATSGGNMSGGVTPVNGLTFGAPSAGTVSKSGVWSFNGLAVGTAGCFRFVASVADANGTSTTLARMDGSVATSGADLNLANIAITLNAPNTCDAFTWTQPAS